MIPSLLRKRWLQLSLLVLAAGALAFGVRAWRSRGSSRKEPIYVGVIASKTGSARKFGKSLIQGVTLAKEVINTKGGLLNGRRVELIVFDDKSSEIEAEANAKELLGPKCDGLREGGRVVALIAEVASSRAKAAGEVAHTCGVPLITPAATHPSVTDRPEVFRVCFIDSFQGRTLARYAVDTLHLRRAIMLVDEGKLYSEGLAGFFKKEFEALGGVIEPEAWLYYSEGDNEFKTAIKAIEKIVSKSPGRVGLFIPGYDREAMLIAQKLPQNLKGRIQLLGGDGWGSVDPGESAIQGAIYSDHYDIDDQENRELRVFRSDYRNRWEEPPDANAGLSHDAAMVLFDAIKRANSTDSTSLLREIGKTKDFRGATGTITLDPDRNAIRPLVIMKIEDGRRQFVIPVKP